VPLNIHEFTLDLTEKQLTEKDGSTVVMKNASFKRDHGSKYFEYKYYMNLSQTDCRMSLEAFSATGRTRRMLLQHSISAFEAESTELQDEHRFAEQLSQRTIADRTSRENFETCPSSVGTNSERPSPPPQRSSRRKYKKGQYINDVPVVPVTSENLFQQTQQVDTEIPPVLDNARQFATHGSERCPDEESLHTTNNAPGSLSDLQNFATAAIREVNQTVDRFLCEDQEIRSPTRVRAADATGADSSSLSPEIPPGGPHSHSRASSDLSSPPAEPHSPEYQVR
jgi:hypothetical protein